MIEHPASRWGDLFEQAGRIFDQANSELTLIDGWTFGGGTALMLQIDHRESFDVDIFLDDPQVLPYLNPKTQGYTLDISPVGYESDGSRTLKIVFENVGEIDFICAPSLTDNPTVKAEVAEETFCLKLPQKSLQRRYTTGAPRCSPATCSTSLAS
nr:nucleotidyl transferase AbiEii/AbiGii toxin family protein [Sinorhizobium americanum]